MSKGKIVRLLINGMPFTQPLPEFDRKTLPAEYCSRFVKLAGEQLFGKRYATAHAWERKYKDARVAHLDEWTLRECVDEGTLQPGMAVGLFCGTSSHNGKLDSRGVPRTYTHVGLFIGNDRGTGEPVIMHQWKGDIICTRESELPGLSLQAIEILDEANEA